MLILQSRYTTRRRRKGHMLIINNMDFSEAPEGKGLTPRIGSDQDAANLHITFADFGYVIETKNNLKALVSLPL